MAFTIEEALRRLTRLEQSENLAHAYLISGASSAYQEELARQLASLILHSNQADLSSHPDFYLVQPTSKSRRILIEQIRFLEQFIQKRPSSGKTKVALIQDADRLFPNAANAFLKSLEEPPNGTYILLLATQPDTLLPTILSRCVRIPLQQPQGMREISSEEQAMVSLFQQCLESRTSPIAQAFQLSRGFQAILAQYKEKSEPLEKFKAERERYKNATDGKWLQAQEETLKALTESNLLRLRRKLIANIESHLGQALCAPYRRGDDSSSQALPQIAQFPQKIILKQLECLERLQRLLDRGVNESLALENCFLELFSLAAESPTTQPVF